MYSLCSLQSRYVTDVIFLTNAGVNVQDQRDPSQLYFYGFLKTSDYRIYASTHNNGRPFICERPGKSFQFYDETGVAGQSIPPAGVYRCSRPEYTPGRSIPGYILA